MCRDGQLYFDPIASVSRGGAQDATQGHLTPLWLIFGILFHFFAFLTELSPKVLVSTKDMNHFRRKTHSNLIFDRFGRFFLHPFYPFLFTFFFKKIMLANGGVPKSKWSAEQKGNGAHGGHLRPWK